MSDLRFPLPQRILARIDHDHALLVAALPVLAELSGWAANYSPDNDGYGAGRSGDGGSRSTDPTSTTERAALAGCSDAEMERIVEGFLAGCTLLLDCHTRLKAYVTPKQRTVGRVSSVDVCPGCDKPAPKVKSGFCPACYQAWLREGRTERGWFIRRRKVEREEAAQREAEETKARKAGKGAA